MIYFVGAGPGDPDLITVKGRKALARADLVIYAGSLVPLELLKSCRQDVIIHNSAKLNLDEVLTLFGEAEKAGKTTVRLHTGDPSLYGAIAEQIREIKKLGYEYEVIPGVSSFAAAAAALGVEYTVPEISQSLIITRKAGRTPVPDGEDIPSFAKHRASMALFLSVFNIADLVSDLKQGYPETTPVAVVYRASWPDQKIVRGDLTDIVDKVKAANITRHALVLVGDFLQAIESEAFAYSKLYDPKFTTGYRLEQKDQPELRSKEERSKKRLGLIYVNAQGKAQAEHIQRQCKDWAEWSFEDLKLADLPQAFHSFDALLFITATGIAVRKIAPLLQDKTRDPAVLVLDTKGEHLISLLSGHLGGANALCRNLASFMNYTPVITTATDLHKVFAIDEWTRQNHYVILNPASIKEVSKTLLDGKHVGLLCAEDVTVTNLPDSFVQLTVADLAATDPYDAYIYVGDVALPEDLLQRLGDRICRILPRQMWLGVGCRKDHDVQELQMKCLNFLKSHGIDPRSIQGLATHEMKRDEPAIRALAVAFDTSLICYPAEQLNTAAEDLDIAHSDFVKAHAGTPAVAGPAAYLAAKEGFLRVDKEKYDGATFALAQEREPVSMELRSNL